MRRAPNRRVYKLPTGPSIPQHFHMSDNSQGVPPGVVKVDLQRVPANEFKQGATPDVGQSEELPEGVVKADLHKEHRFPGIQHLGKIGPTQNTWAKRQKELEAEEKAKSEAEPVKKD